MTDERAEPRPCLTVVMPCFNEQATVGVAIGRVLRSPWVSEIIVVDDGSTDGTSDEIAAVDDARVTAIAMPANQGKGAAVRAGFALAGAEFVIVQDADLEYDPSDFERILEPLVAGAADVVYGSRFVSGRPHRVLYFWHSVGNRLLTLLSNAFTDLNLTDMETCYKAFRRDVIQSIDLREDGFGFEPEVTAKVAALRCRVFEVGISYHGRTYDDGKKIGWRDGLWAVVCIVRYSPLVARRRGS